MNSIDFSALLASRVHDIKNTLGYLINQIDTIGRTTTDEKSRTELEHLQFQSKSINTHLIQLLVLYRIDQSQYFPHTVDTEIKSFLEESIEPYYQLFAQKQIVSKIYCEKDLYWHLDCDLMNGALGNILHNLYQYAQSRVEIIAKKVHQSLIIQIKDDGPGYPEEILLSSGQQQKKFSFASASTGLGLYFVEIAAKLHQHNGNEGHIVITNEGIDGGGCITIKLP